MMASIPAKAHAVAPPAHLSLIPHWLTHLGPLGLFAVAVLDSSVIPLPLPGSTDLLLLWLVSHHGDALLLVATATGGSILGGYTNWSTGKRGGEAALQRYVKARLLSRISGWVQHHSVLAVFLPAILPPPMPMSAFLIAAGALGISRERFLLTFGAARVVRYSLIALLAATYGRRVVRLWSGALEKWSDPLILAFVVILLSGICYGAWRLRKEQPKRDEMEQAVV